MKKIIKRHQKGIGNVLKHHTKYVNKNEVSFVNRLHDRNTLVSYNRSKYYTIIGYDTGVIVYPNHASVRISFKCFSSAYSRRSRIQYNYYSNTVMNIDSNKYKNNIGEYRDGMFKLKTDLLVSIV